MNRLALCRVDTEFGLDQVASELSATTSMIRGSVASDWEWNRLTELFGESLSLGTAKRRWFSRVSASDCLITAPPEVLEAAFQAVPDPHDWRIETGLADDLVGLNEAGAELWRIDADTGCLLVNDIEPLLSDALRGLGAEEYTSSAH